MTDDALTHRYDAASALWADKMRLLGYYDGYLGFLSHWTPKASDGGHGSNVADIGAGTGAMAEAWVAVRGAPQTLTLLDPSAPMLDRAALALARREVAPVLRPEPLRAGVLPPQDVLLAAHVIEHFDDPVAVLQDMASLLRPGGRLYLVVSKPHWCNAIIWLQWRHRTYRPATIRDLLEGAGYSLEAEYAFPSGPPSRTSHGYVAVRT